MLSNIGFPGLILILLLALIVFGPNKLPQIGRAVGTSLREFKDATKGITEEIQEEFKDDVQAAKKETIKWKRRLHAAGVFDAFVAQNRQATSRRLAKSLFFDLHKLAHRFINITSATEKSNQFLNSFFYLYIFRENPQNNMHA